MSYVDKLHAQVIERWKRMSKRPIWRALFRSKFQARMISNGQILTCNGTGER